MFAVTCSFSKPWSIFVMLVKPDGIERPEACCLCEQVSRKHQGNPLHHFWVSLFCSLPLTRGSLNDGTCHYVTPIFFIVSVNAFTATDQPLQNFYLMNSVEWLTP